MRAPPLSFSEGLSIGVGKGLSCIGVVYPIDFKEFYASIED
jgi:hypothetical protein